jgi:hypothetical protein
MRARHFCDSERANHGRFARSLQGRIYGGPRQRVASPPACDKQRRIVLTLRNVWRTVWRLNTQSIEEFLYTLASQ